MTLYALPHIRRFNERRDDPPAEMLVRQAHVILGNCGVVMSPGKVLRLVRGYQGCAQGNGWGFFDYLATAVQLSVERQHAARTDPEIMRIIAYADPTGETAVRHVMEAP